MEQNTFICRTCLKSSIFGIEYVPLSNRIENNQMSIKDMLEKVMPELDLDITGNESRMCFSCLESLKIAYFFKNTCLETEERIYNYLNLKNEKKNNLSHLIEQRHFDNILELGSNSLGLNCPPINENDNSHQSDVILVEDDQEEQTQSIETPECKKSPKIETAKSHNYSCLKRNHTCDLCEYKTSKLDLLKIHKQKHNKSLLNIKEYKCHFCFYITTRKRYLDRHVFKHKGQSGHSCEFCTKNFAEKYQLKLHLMKHTGEDFPRRCEECGKGFFSESHLKKHMEDQHLAKECDICQCTFSCKKMLDAHKYTHTGEDFPYKCEHCHFSTAWKGLLKRHVKSNHSLLNY